MMEKKDETAKARLIREIVETEWQMFDKVNNEGGRASCQNDAWTFQVMRTSQFMPLPVDVLESYADDLRRAAAEGRNLLMEKYAYMMEYTDPDTFARMLRPYIPAVSSYKEALVARVANALLADEKAFAARYPKLHAKSRPLQGQSAEAVSVHIYALGELKTYSEETLARYDAFLRGRKDESENISVAVHRAMVAAYGYGSLEEAEARQ